MIFTNYFLHAWRNKQKPGIQPVGGINLSTKNCPSYEVLSDLAYREKEMDRYEIDGKRCVENQRG